MRTRITVIAVALFIVIGGFAIACEGTDSGEKARETAVQSRDEGFDKAVAAVPQPQSVNFPARAALAEFSRRQDRAVQEYFVYFTASTGNVVDYFASSTVPVSVCAFLSSTEDVVTRHEGTIVLTAPSLDGIFYGGAGASAACDGLILFDAVTDAMVIVYPGDMAVTISDVPRELDLEPVRFIAP